MIFNLRNKIMASLLLFNILIAAIAIYFVFNRATIRLALSAGVIIIMLDFGLSSLIAIYILKPIKKLLEGFNQINSGIIKTRLRLNRKDEFRYLEIGFNAMADSISRFMDDIKLVVKVFENSSEGVILTNSATKIIQVNKAFTDITGYTLSDVINKKADNYSTGWDDYNTYENIWTDIIEKGIWQGDIWDKRKDGSLCALSESVIALKNDEGYVNNYLIILRDITEKQKAEEQIKKMAFFDTLTGLPNRAMLYDRLEKTIAQSSRFNNEFAVMFLDLDDFKKVNDTFGHNSGDLLLKTVAYRLQLCLRKYDSCSRLAGDEFTILLVNIKERKDISLIASRIIEKFEEPFDIQGQQIIVGCSIGISIYPVDGITIQDLMKKADMAMYHAKSNGKNKYQFYHAKLYSENYQRMRIGFNLIDAVQRNEFLIYYQPVINLVSGKISGLEALIRWIHPELGLIMPSDFIPGSGAIKPD